MDRLSRIRLPAEFGFQNVAFVRIFRLTLDTDPICHVDVMIDSSVIKCFVNRDLARNAETLYTPAQSFHNIEVWM